MIKRLGFVLGLVAVLPLAAKAQTPTPQFQVRKACVANLALAMDELALDARRVRLRTESATDAPSTASPGTARSGGGGGRGTAQAPAGAVARSGGARSGGGGGAQPGQATAGAGARGRGAEQAAMADVVRRVRAGSVSWLAGPTFEDALFTPEQILARQEAIQLTDVQRATINNEVARLQSQTAQLQQQVAEQQTALRQLLEARPIDDQAAVAQLGRLMDLEAQVKNLNFLSMVQIKNTLSEAQVTQLKELMGRC